MCWIVSRTWSVTLNTTIGSSAAPGGSSSVVIASPNWMIHLLGSGISPRTPNHGNGGVIGKYGTPIARASVGAVEISG